MSPQTLLNIRIAEVQARWNYRRQFLAPAVLPITQTGSLHPVWGKERSASSGPSFIGKSRKFRMARLVRHGQLRLWGGKES